MNTKHVTTRNRRSPRGWSLVELLFVMAIMVGLAALLVSQFGGVGASADQKRTRATLAMIEAGLQQYHSHYGGYPICTDLKNGSSVLYKSLYGDFNGNGIPDNDTTDLNDGAVKCFIPDFQPRIDSDTGLLDENSKSPIQEDPETGEYIVTDAFGNKFFYMNFPNGHPERDRQHNTGGFDLFSMGLDRTGQDEAKWIKNW